MRLMTGYLNSLCGFAAAAIIAAAAPLGVARAADLKDARVWAGSEYTRLVLDATGPLHYTISQKDGEVVIDLPDSRATRDFSEPAAQGLYRGMSHTRVGDRLLLTARVDSASRLKSFLLKPNSGRDYRLVLDIYPDGKKASSQVAGLAPAAAVVPQYSTASARWWWRSTPGMAARTRARMAPAARWKRMSRWRSPVTWRRRSTASRA
jgi:N-acetylmuramoyl-L-alanine amidase